MIAEKFIKSKTFHEKDDDNSSDQVSESDEDVAELPPRASTFKTYVQARNSKNMHIKSHKHHSDVSATSSS